MPDILTIFLLPFRQHVIVSHVGHTPSGAGILSASAITSNQFRGFSSIATAVNAVLGRYIAIGV